MKILLMPNSFKGTIKAIEAAQIIESAIISVMPKAKIIKMPMSDGGDGFLDFFYYNKGGTKKEVTVSGPLGKSIIAQYLILPSGKTAVIEMAKASGLATLRGKKDAMRAHSFGTGQLLEKALSDGCREILLGIGGSAGVDCGTGIARALGVRFLDKENFEVPLGGEFLASIENVDFTKINPLLYESRIQVFSDVNNGLFGNNGAAHVYGPQKGASPEEIKNLDNRLRHMHSLFLNKFSKDINFPGAGAAGGTGAMLAGILGAKLTSGINALLDAINFENLANNADLIITGEGRIDFQSLAGKVPYGIALRAKRLNKPVIVICGDAEGCVRDFLNEGIQAVFSTNRKAVPFKKAIKTAKEDLKETTENIFRAINIFVGGN